MHARLRRTAAYLFSPAPLPFCLRLVALVALFTAATLTGPFRRFVEVPLIDFHAWMVQGVLRGLGAGTMRTGAVVASPEFAFEIVSGCTGLFVFVLLLSAVLAFPAGWRARLAGVILGAVWILFLNLARLVTLFYIGIGLPEYFEESHVFVWQGLIVVAVAVYWYVWALKARAREPAGS